MPAFGPEAAETADPAHADDDRDTRRGTGRHGTRQRPRNQQPGWRRAITAPYRFLTAPFRRVKLPAWAEVIFYVGFALILTSLIKTFFVQMYFIPSPSMEPYTYKGDRVFVDKLSPWFGSDPARGDVVVFHDPHHWLPGANSNGGGPVLNLLAAVGVLPDQHDDLLIKRIVGVGGDTVECKAVDGPVYLNGKPLDETAYIMNGKNGRPCNNGTYKVTVPKGQLWLLGDNRTESADSSYNYIRNGGDAKAGNDAGFVPTGNVVGHVVGVVSWLRDSQAVKNAPLPNSPYVSDPGNH